MSHYNILERIASLRHEVDVMRIKSGRGKAPVAGASQQTWIVDSEQSLAKNVGKPLERSRIMAIQ